MQGSDGTAHQVRDGVLVRALGHRAADQVEDDFLSLHDPRKCRAVREVPLRPGDSLERFRIALSAPETLYSRAQPRERATQVRADEATAPEHEAAYALQGLNLGALRHLERGETGDPHCESSSPLAVR